jgi:hypothetical protein
LTTQTRILSRILVTRLAVAGALAALAATTAAADPAPAPLQPPEGWQFEFTPYLWASSLHGDLGVTQAIQPVHVELSAWDLISHLKFGLMGRLDARNDHWVGFSDLVYADTKFSSHITIRDSRFISGSVRSKVLLSTNLVGYRVIDEPKTSVDLLAGVRFDYLDTGITLQGPRRSFSGDVSKFWADPLLGARLKYQLARKWDARVWGDFGGFGAGSKFTGEVEGDLEYRFHRRWTANVGWRYLYTDYDNNGFVFNTSMSGPVIGATYRF